jgi:hypothetical protein
LLYYNIMPKRISRKNRKGGFLGFFEGSSSQEPNKKSMWSSWFGTTPTTTTPTYSSTTTTTTPNYSSTTPSYTSTAPSYNSTQQMNYGGKRRSRTKSKRGGYTANTPTTGLASTGAPFSGPTAKPQHWVGGKTKRRHHKKHSRTCRH